MSIRDNHILNMQQFVKRENGIMPPDDVYLPSVVVALLITKVDNQAKQIEQMLEADAKLRIEVFKLHRQTNNL